MEVSSGVECGNVNLNNVVTVCDRRTLFRINRFCRFSCLIFLLVSTYNFAYRFA